MNAFVQPAHCTHRIVTVTVFCLFMENRALLCLSNSLETNKLVGECFRKETLMIKEKKKFVK